jgi:hypothetical protein
MGNIIEIYGMKMEIVENAHPGHNWCTMCALEPICDKITERIESQLYPCTDTKGNNNRYFKRIWDKTNV